MVDSVPQIVAPIPRAAAALRPTAQSLDLKDDDSEMGNQTAALANGLDILIRPGSAVSAMGHSSRTAVSPLSRPASAPLQQEKCLCKTQATATKLKQFFGDLPPVGSWVSTTEHQHEGCRRQVQAIKLQQFFGDLPPVDISITEIEKDGLKALLQSSLPICYFLHSLLMEYSCENLFFLLEVEHYEAYKFATDEQRYETAVHIFDIYLSRDSLLEINIDDRVMRSVEAALESKESLATLFDKAKDAVIVLMEGSYAKFTKSPSWSRMVEDLGPGKFYSQRAQHKAAALLREYLRDRSSVPAQRFSLYDVLARRSPALQQASGPDHLRRDRLITSMVEEFCFKVAKVDVKQRSNFELDDDGDSGKRRRSLGRLKFGGGFGLGVIITRPKSTPPSESPDKYAARIMMFSVCKRSASETEVTSVALRWSSGPQV